MFYSQDISSSHSNSDGMKRGSWKEEVGFQYKEQQSPCWEEEVVVEELVQQKIGLQFVSQIKTKGCLFYP